MCITHRPRAALQGRRRRPPRGGLIVIDMIIDMIIDMRLIIDVHRQAD